MSRFLRSRTALVLAVLLDLLVRPGGGEAPIQRLLDRAPEDILSQEVLAAAFAAQNQLTADLIGQPGVVGTAVGISATGVPVLRVYTAGPGIMGIPASLNGMAIIPSVTGEIWALGELPEADANLNPAGEFPRPVPIGVSTGHPDVTAGTIGARVTDGTAVYALSNNHVSANSNGGKIGDNVLQPGVADGGRNPSSTFGTLHDFEPIKFCSALLCPNNKIDAAIAITSTENLGTSTPENGYGEPRSETVTATLNLSVQKYGRTTGHTTGTVTGIHATINVNYRNGQARFVDQVIISGPGAFSQGGDSGSLIVTKARGGNDRRPVALLFAGSANTTIANPIDQVLDRFKITIDGS